MPYSDFHSFAKISRIPYLTLAVSTTLNAQSTRTILQCRNCSWKPQPRSADYPAPSRWTVA